MRRDLWNSTIWRFSAISNPATPPRPVKAGPLYFANCSVALRSSSGSVHCTKHNYPDDRDKSEGHKRGPRHELLPVVGLWTKPPNLSVTTVTAPFRDQCFFRHRTVAPRGCHDYHSFNLGPLNGRPYFFRERLAPMRLRLQ